jgi:hypothetical protein
VVSAGLSINGLQMPSDFPTVTFESIYGSARKRERLSPVLFEQFGGAWNAVAYRYFTRKLSILTAS